MVGGAMRMRRGPSKDLWKRVLGRGNSKCKEGHRLDVFDRPPGASVTGAEGAGERLRLQTWAEVVVGGLPLGPSGELGSALWLMACCLC